MNNFNFVAPFYDSLVSLVFGQQIEKASDFFLGDIKGQKVLVFGGGTGKILEALDKSNEVTYIEKSAKMIDIAQRRSMGNVSFLNQDALLFSSSDDFDVVVCPFFLDCFNDKNLDSLITSIKRIMAYNGKLIVSDFQRTNSNGLLIWIMHLFFRVFSGLESKKLVNIHSRIVKKGLILENEEFFHKNMIFSRVYGNL